jgi:hypothetical protein
VRRSLWYLEKKIFGEENASLKTAILLLVLLVLPSAAPAEEQVPERPRWSLEVKGGEFSPALQNWSQTFGDSKVREFAASFAYKVLQQIDLGAGVGTMRSKGLVFNQFHGNLAGNTTLQLYPVNLFVMLRGEVVDGQWVVPYIGGGWTRMYYRQRFEDGSVRGSADGSHVRGGLQFSLDILDQTAANRMYIDYGIFHTFLFVELEKSRVVERSTSIDLGGKAYYAGLLFEF